ncbi:hypothetical protein DVB69_05015 [Sporosarcina sp. BI001-red]|nr:hypothetical protein DVB69_05015 [Sporosarcina sp. BI001-red]
MNLHPASSEGIIDVRERQTMYIISATVGDSYFDSITVDYAKNIIRFNQVDRSNAILGDAVLKALQELGIQEFTPHSMSFCMIPPNRKVE